MSISRRQLIAFTCVLLLQLGLFSSLVHAAEHPFHVQNDLCASFINFGQHDLSVDIATPAVEFKQLAVESSAENKFLIHAVFRTAYSSRAPPAS